MRQEDGDVAFLAEMFVLGNHLLGGLETDAVQIVGMGAGNTFRTGLDATDDAHLQSLHIKHLIRHQTDATGVGREGIGTDVSEIRQSYQPFQGVNIELMVA